MLPKTKELFLLKEELIKKGIYDRNYKKKQEKLLKETETIINERNYKR